MISFGVEPRLRNLLGLSSRRPDYSRVSRFGNSTLSRFGIRSSNPQQQIWKNGGKPSPADLEKWRENAQKQSCCVYAAAFLRATGFGKRAGNVLKDKVAALNATALFIQGQRVPRVA